MVRKRKSKSNPKESKKQSNPNTMTTLKTSLEVFETYKRTGSEAEKSSDEESIHLVLEPDDEKDTTEISPIKEEELLDEFVDNEQLEDQTDENKENVEDNQTIDSQDKKEEIKETLLEAPNENTTEETEEAEPTEEPMEPAEELMDPTEEPVDPTPTEETTVDEEESATMNNEEDQTSQENEEATATPDLSVSVESTEEAPASENQQEKGSDSNDSIKDSNELFHISQIKDIDEDNAEAIEENAQYNADADEKLMETEDQEDSNSEKVEDEEVILDQETLELALEPVVDGEDIQMEVEEATKVEASINVSECEIEETLNNSKLNPETGLLDNCDSGLVKESDTEQKTESVVQTNGEIDEDNKDNIEDDIKSTKRSLSDSDSLHSDTKKIKLADDVKEEKPKPSQTYLLNFVKYMDERKIISELSFNELEQFCLQKICEVIMHRSKEGKMYDRIKKQEQTIETMRNSIQQLVKQARDLEIVNKKMMSDLRQNGKRKPLVPLKITRSVGMQVNVTHMDMNRRKISANVVNVINPQNQAKIVSSPSKLQQKTVVRNNATIVRQMPVQKPATPVTTTQQGHQGTPLLSQALQTVNRRTSQTITPPQLNKRTPIRPKPQSVATTPVTPTEPPALSVPSKPNNTSSSVIDLTDEDDKVTTGTSAGGQAKPQAHKLFTVNQKNLTPVRAVGNRPLTSLPQGAIRVAPNKNLTGVVTANTPHVMYVMQQPSGQGTTNTTGQHKTIFLNFQTTANGIINNNLNTAVIQPPPPPPVKKHPAPLPVPPVMRLGLEVSKPIPPKPYLSIKKTETGIILQWRMPYNLDMYETIASYQLYAYQETNAVPSTEMWRKVGDVKALALPMACTLTQFADKNKYYFAVRSVDIHKRIGSFSEPQEISL